MKRNLRTNFIGIFIYVFLMSCSSKKTDSLETFYYPNGSIDSIVPRHNDTINGIIKRFYRNGTLKEERPYKMGSLEGISYGYYQNGKIEYKISYQSNELNGLSIHYYPKGSIEMELNFLNGKQFGDTKSFYVNGNTEKYNCYDFENNNRYFIKYDSIGKIVHEEGTVLGQVFLDSDFKFDSIPRNTEINLKISVAAPPGRKSTVCIKETGYKDSVMLPISQNIASFKKNFKKAGEFTFISIGTMYDMQNNLIKKDSIITTFRVK